MELFLTPISESVSAKSRRSMRRIAVLVSLAALFASLFSGTVFATAPEDPEYQGGSAAFTQAELSASAQASAQAWETKLQNMRTECAGCDISAFETKVTEARQCASNLTPSLLPEEFSVSYDRCEGLFASLEAFGTSENSGTSGDDSDEDRTDFDETAFGDAEGMMEGMADEEKREMLARMVGEGQEFSAQEHKTFVVRFPQDFDRNVCEDAPKMSDIFAQEDRELEALRARGAIGQDQYEVCSAAFAKRQEMAVRVRDACTQNQTVRASDLMDTAEILSKRAEFKCRFALPVSPQAPQISYEAFEERFDAVDREDLEALGNHFRAEFQGKVFENVVAKVEARIFEDFMAKMKSLVESAVKNALAMIVENLAVINPEVSEEVLKHKSRALDCASQMKEISLRDGASELQEIMVAIQDATPVGESAKKLHAVCQGFVAQATDLRGKALANIVKQFAESAREILDDAAEEAVEKGVTCAKDVPVSQWYHKEMCSVVNKEAKFIEGSRVGFEPGRAVNLVEVLKIAARVTDASIPSSVENCPEEGGCTEWFAPYVLWVKEQGFTLFEELREKGPGASASRGLVVRTILEAAGVEVSAQATGTVYADVSSDHPHAAYIEKATELGLVSGTEREGKTLFYPDRGVLRGEMAKIANNSFYLFGGDVE